MGEKMERHTMTGKKRGKKMKPIKAWALIAHAPNKWPLLFATRKQARSTQKLNELVFHRVARVLISEIPSGRGK